jgi:hypothetical protein
MKLTENNLYEKCIENIGSVSAEHLIYTLYSIFQILIQLSNSLQ